MALVAKKRMSQTWPDAIAAQAGPSAPVVLAAFEAACALGTPDYIAAYEALEAHGLLASVSLPGESTGTLAQAEEAQIEPDGEFPA